MRSSRLEAWPATTCLRRAHGEWGGERKSTCVGFGPLAAFEQVEHPVLARSPTRLPNATDRHGLPPAQCTLREPEPHEPARLRGAPLHEGSALDTEDLALGGAHPRMEAALQVRHLAVAIHRRHEHGCDALPVKGEALHFLGNDWVRVRRWFMLRVAGKGNSRHAPRRAAAL